MTTITVHPSSDVSLQLQTNDVLGHWHALLTNDGDVSEVDANNLVNLQGTDTYGNGAVIPAGSTVNSVTISAVAKKVQSGTVRITAISLGLNSATIVNHALTTAYLTYSSVAQVTNPLTGLAWTIPDILALQTNLTLAETESGTNVTYGQATELYVVVDYTTPSGAPARLTIFVQGTTTVYINA